MGAGRNLVAPWRKVHHAEAGVTQRLLLDKVPQGKHQTLDLKLVLAQDTKRQGKVSHFLESVGVRRGRELCRGL